jgi:hypothetical protein
MGSITRGWLLAVALLLLPALARADVIPLDGTFLTGLGPDRFRFITDGTSNTILLTEETQLAVCLDHVGGTPRTSITDGSSNTIMFGDGAVRPVRAGRVTPRQPISQIADGSSNTIIIGETPPDSLCLGGDTRPIGEITDGSSNTIIIGEESSFDVCFRRVRVGTIVDGTSNTIQFGEVTTAPVCYDGVRVALDPLAAPEPAAPAVLALGLAALLRARRRQAI